MTSLSTSSESLCKARSSALNRIDTVVHLHHHFGIDGDKLDCFKKIVKHNIEVPMIINSFLYERNLFNEESRVVIPLIDASSLLNPAFQEGYRKIFKNAFLNMLMCRNKLQKCPEVSFCVLNWKFIVLDYQANLMEAGVDMKMLTELTEETKVIETIEMLVDREKVSDLEFRSKEWRV